MSQPASFIRFLSAAQIQRLYQMHITRSNPSQLSLLESAVSSPQNHKHYGETNIFKLAGILAERIILNHSYQDGNKRIALLAADMFLKMNGYQLQRKPFATDDVNEGLKNAHVAVASNQWTAENLAAYYQQVAKPVMAATKEIIEYKSKAQTI
jgi:death-on-curing family protein